jgi:hypothetical protein
MAVGPALEHGEEEFLGRLVFREKFVGVVEILAGLDPVADRVGLLTTFPWIRCR